MKKLLSLLSVLTIGGTAVPTTIAASPYQKEENIKNDEIIFSQTSNLENLNRNKRKAQYDYYNNSDYNYNNGWNTESDLNDDLYSRSSRRRYRPKVSHVLDAAQTAVDAWGNYEQHVQNQQPTERSSYGGYWY